MVGQHARLFLVQADVWSMSGWRHRHVQFCNLPEPTTEMAADRLLFGPNQRKMPAGSQTQPASQMGYTLPRTLAQQHLSFPIARLTAPVEFSVVETCRRSVVCSTPARCFFSRVLPSRTASEDARGSSAS